MQHNPKENSLEFTVTQKKAYSKTTQVFSLNIRSTKSGEKKSLNKSVGFGHTKQEGATALLLFATII